MATPEKIRTNRLRKMARRQGLRLSKTRRRDPRAIDYDGWMVIDMFTNRAVYGGQPYAYSATLDEVEAYLLRDRD